MLRQSLVRVLGRLASPFERSRMARELRCLVPVVLAPCTFAEGHVHGTASQRVCQSADSQKGGQGTSSTPWGLQLKRYQCMLRGWLPHKKAALSQSAR